MPNFGERLRETREAMGLSQTAFAEMCGVGMRSQRNYEKGERSPDAEYMSALFRADIDIRYLLTGVRGEIYEKISNDLDAANTEISALVKIGEEIGLYKPNPEKVLLELFRQSTQAGKEAIIATARAVEKSK